MILAIDIGNTNITFALMDKNGRIRRKHKTPTSKPVFNSVPENSRNLEKIIVVSVVPSALRELKKILKKRFKKTKILVVGENVKVPLVCEYNKSQIGQDRLVTAYAAAKLCGPPVLIIDFGTAVTFDAVSKSGVYIGGLIVPGIKMSLDSLSERTALLPKTYLKRTNSFIGKNTESSIRNGMIYGYAALCEGMIRLFRKKVSKDIKVIATGGDAALISQFSPSMRKIDANLSLKGLYLLSR